MCKQRSACVESAPQPNEHDDSFFVVIAARKDHNDHSKRQELVANLEVFNRDDLVVVTLLNSDYRLLQGEPFCYSQLITVASNIAVNVIAIDLSDMRMGAAFLGSLVCLANGLERVGKLLVTFGDGIGIMRIANLDQLIPTFNSFDDLWIRNCRGDYRVRFRE